MYGGRDFQSLLKHGISDGRKVPGQNLPLSRAGYISGNRNITHEVKYGVHSKVEFHLTGQYQTTLTFMYISL